ncbi:PREDICTED: synaptonemal complex protein 1 [Propithecus coquereli]|uniref:synaptonemal complex protein 1 n=1 Tax=Propithecus coquereli TaxID=379532 RepID=UPI00063F3BCA|nr:PREDICTED: synaptonemal complex protein 1 [Propithecus coquereli]
MWLGKGDVTKHFPCTERGLSRYTKKAPLPHCALPHTKDRATTPSPRPPGLVVPVPPAKPQRRKRPDYSSQQPPRPSPAPSASILAAVGASIFAPSPHFSHHHHHYHHAPRWSQLLASVCGLTLASCYPHLDPEVVLTPTAQRPLSSAAISSTARYVGINLASLARVPGSERVHGKRGGSFNKCIEDDYDFPFAMTTLSRNGENIDSDPALRKVNFLPMLEQIGNSDSCHYQEGLKDSGFEFGNEKVSLKLEEGIQENKDLIKENNATRHLCNLLKETCGRSAEKTKKYEYEREETRQVYMDLNNNIEIEWELQNENLKESNEKQDHLASELEDTKVSLQRSMSTQKALEEDLQIATKTIYQLTGEKESQMEEFNKAKAAHSFVVTELKTTICNLKELLRTEQQRLEKDEDQLKILTMELQKKSSELEEMTKFKNNKEVELEELKKVVAENQKHLDEKKQFEKIAEELKGTKQELIGLLQTREKEVHDLEIKLTATATSEQHYSKQVKDLKTELENEKLKNTELTASCNKLSLENKELAQETSDMVLEIKKQQEDINNRKQQEERMLKQIENLEEAETQLSVYLVEKAKLIADEAVKLQKEIDIRCQHKIAEMVALMEKHKHQYDKIVEERDSELGLYKSKEQEQLSMKASLEIELSNLKNELLSVKKQLQIEREEKKTQTSLLETPETSYRKFDSKAASSQNISRNFTSVDHGKSKDRRDYLWTSAKRTLSTPKVKTPTKMKIHQRENKNIPTEENNKKRKMVFEFDINSDSSEPTDLLSMVSEEETLKKLCKNNNPPTSHLCVRTPKKTPSSLTAPGSSVKVGSMRTIREDHWSVISKMDRKKKVKEAEKLFV